MSKVIRAIFIASISLAAVYAIISISYIYPVIKNDCTGIVRGDSKFIIENTTLPRKMCSKVVERRVVSGEWHFNKNTGEIYSSFLRSSVTSDEALRRFLYSLHSGEEEIIFRGDVEVLKMEGRALGRKTTYYLANNFHDLSILSIGKEGK